MANKPKPLAELLANWIAMLAEATAYLKLKRAEALRAKEELRVRIREAFDAGLAATPMREAAGPVRSLPLLDKAGRAKVNTEALGLR
jgi:hypothetical protein